MLKAALFVSLLLTTDMQVNGDKARGTVAEKSRPEEKVKTKEAEPVNSLESDSASSGFLGNLLVVPMDGSHWVAIKALAQEIGRRGHRVTVVIPEISIRMGPGKHYNTVTYPVPYDKAFIDSVMSTHKDVMRKSTQSFVEKVKKRFAQIQKITGLLHTTAESLLFNASLISHLAQQNFDAVLTDPMVPTGSLIARKLGLPTVNLLRGIPCSLDIKAAGCPSPPSFVPRFFTRYTDKMNFKQRAFNTLIALLEPLMCRVLYWHFDNLAYQFLGEEVGIAEVLSDSAIWLLRIDFALEFPRPLMPNIILVGGINCNVRNPLPEDLESWVSGEHGFVVFTLGTMISDMPEEITAIFLEAFRQIPQKGICHAVPMLMLPISGDQPDNAQRLASKGAGVVLDILSITTESLLKGLNDIIKDPRYKENMLRLSSLHKDRPVEPLDLSVHWTEFVMRHKGAKHLKAAVHDLNWFQYYCLDVIVLLATVVLVFVMLTVKCLKLCFSRLSRKRKQD
ncbi:UDP-glucuronosyltransferase 1-1 [Collichthys lucidus]|uniref:glucuronosyltransferase n=1 Tax=Collichthys lucidus TaxID=240159 RepID=A0A4U5V1Y6_COLLU|nr:UDP-glucuronosyltransferase 1-1 [Collichthys lucidus]